MSAAFLIAIGAFPAFTAGWFARDLYNILRGKDG